MAELRWSILAIGLIFSATMVAFIFRYELLSQQSNPMKLTFVWDRWNARTCMTGVASNHKMLCTLEEMDEFGRRYGELSRPPSRPPD